MNVVGGIVWLGALEGETTSTVGRRALALDRMMREGFNVPAGFVLPVRMFGEFLAGSDLGPRLDAILAGHDPANEESLEDASRRAVAAIVGTGLPREHEVALKEAYDELTYGRELSKIPRSSKGLVMSRNPTFAAVRSSHPATDEGGTSLLNVKGDADLGQAVRRCWAVVFEPAFLPSRSRSSGDASDVAVIVQRMVEPEASGVARTQASGHPGALEVRAVAGIGSLLGTSEAPGDRFRIDRRSLGIVQRAVSFQSHRLARDDVCERLERTERIAVGTARARAPKLPDGAVRDVGQTALRLEGLFGQGPLEVAWALCRGKLWILGARPQPPEAASSGDAMAPAEPMLAPCPAPTGGDALAAPPLPAGAGRPSRVVLPVGSVEDHGPHLPATTDTLIAQALAARLASRAGALCLPALPYGYCRTTSSLPGTVSVGFDAVRAIVRDIVSSLVKGGVREVIIVTGHGGSAHLTALQEGASAAAAEVAGSRVMVASPWHVDVSDIVGATPSHADEAETSLVLAIAPGQVRMDLARQGQPRTGGQAFVAPAPTPATAVWGDPTLATAAKGEAILARWEDALSRMVDERLGAAD